MPSISQRYAFFYALSRGDKESLEILHKGGVPWSVTHPDSEDTPIHAALTHERPDMLAFFEDKGCDLNAKNAVGETPLHLAVRVNRAKDVAFLLENGANPSLTNNDGNTPYQEALKIGNLKILNMLATHSTKVKREYPIDALGNTELHHAVIKRDLKRVKELCAAGANVNAKNKYNIAPIEYAPTKECKTEEIKILDELIAHGANLEETKYSIVQSAAFFGHTQMLKYLATRGLSMDPAITHVLFTPGYEDKFKDCVEFLKDWQSNPNKYIGVSSSEPDKTSSKEETITSPRKKAPSSGKFFKPIKLGRSH